MKKCQKKLVAWLGVMFLVSFALSIGSAAASPPEIDKVTVEPTAEQILLVATNYLKQKQQFSFKAEITEDVVFEDNQLIQTNHTMSYFAKRPNKLKFKIEGDVRDREWFYDGNTIAAYDRRNGFYSQESFPPTLDQALLKAEKELNLRLSIAGIARTDFYSVIMNEVNKASVVGMSKVGEVPCYQLLLEREWANVQFWIQAGETPLFRKIVVTYKQDAGSPQWSAVLNHWDTVTELPDRLFKFAPPEGAVKIKFLQQIVTGSSQ